MAEESTQFCANCKHDIPEANFTMHELHCRRNIALCEVCQEPLPRADLLQHREQEHAQVKCKCGLKVDKSAMETHQSSECSQRLVPCQYCDLELVSSQSREHEEYCGTRTEPCPLCKCNVMLREQPLHPALCGSLTPPQERNNIQEGRGSAEPQAPGAWFEAHSVHNMLRFQEGSHNNDSSSVGASDRRPAPQPLEGRVHNSTQGPMGLGLRANVAPRNTFSHLLEQEAESGNNNNNSLAWPAHQSPGEEDPSSLDYLLALSLQTDGELGGQSALWTDVWDQLLGRAPDTSLFSPISPPNNLYPANPPSRDSAPNPHQIDTMLPCEFCEELFPEEDLILHQTGCSPASAFASFSKRPSSPHRADRVVQAGAGGLMYMPPDSPGSPTLPRSVSPPSCSPPSSPLEGDVVIPCEFCGVALEENVVFHHQDKCDLRPRTVHSLDKGNQQSALKPLDVPKLNTGRSSPELQRRLRHQVDPGEELLGLDRERPPIQAPQVWTKGGAGTDPWRPSARNRVPLPGKNSNVEGAVKNGFQRGRNPDGGASVHHFPLNESHKPSSSTASLGRPHLRETLEGRRNLRHTGTPKVPKKPNVEKEDWE